MDSLQYFNIYDWEWTGRLKDLKCALILHHDAETVTMEERLDLYTPYDKSVLSRVRDLALTYFTQQDRKPKDPLQLSHDEFCKEYHSHSQHNQPCYKTKSLPEQL